MLILVDETRGAVDGEVAVGLVLVPGPRLYCLTQDVGGGRPFGQRKDSLHRLIVCELSVVALVIEVLRKLQH